MISASASSPRSSSPYSLLRLLLAAVLVIALVPSPFRHTASPRAASGLLALARQQPAVRVAVIVRRERRATGLEQVLSGMGGVVTRDLPMIDAFAAEIPASAIPALARAGGVRWVSPDAPVTATTGSGCLSCIDTSELESTYTSATGAHLLWNEAPAYLQGQGVTVAVVDSGVSPSPKQFDLKGRIVANVETNAGVKNMSDWYGHGTHVAGIIGGNGRTSSGAYIGMAPRVNIVNVKVSDDQGAATTSDVVGGLQWIYENKDRFNIRVVNLSLNSDVPESYRTSALDAAIEALWFDGIVVVVSAGNNGTGGVLYPPANDPYAIVVGATDDRGTASWDDDGLASYSASGTTESGFTKPDLVAPGTNIVSILASKRAKLAREHQDHVVNDFYLRMSGTSMASAVAAGAVALLLQDEPWLTPDQVKYRLVVSARPLGPEAGAGMLDIYNAVHATTSESANTGLAESQILQPATGWEAENLASVSWGSVSWGSDYWGD